MAISETTTDHATWSVTIGHIYVVLWCDLQKGRKKKRAHESSQTVITPSLLLQKKITMIFLKRHRLNHGYYSLTAKYLSN